MINQRPIGLSTTLEDIKPADVIPIWSRIKPAECFMKNCSKIINDAIQEFRKRWDCLYKTCILQQKKWMTSNHDLEKDDLVLVLDLKNNLNYPKTGRIKDVEADHSGINRYFHVEYKIGKRVQSVKRTAQSLVLLLKKSEDKAAEISDSLFWCPDSINISENKKKVKVQTTNSTDEILDL